MSFLNKIWENLKQKKTETEAKQQSQPQLQKPLQRFKGFKTIPIQILEDRKIFKGENKSGTQIWTKKFRTPKILCYEQNCHLSVEKANGFFSAFHEAYINHGDIKITPDEVWMVIMLWFSKYLNDNAEQLRKAFVGHETKKKLLIETSVELKETQWNQFFQKVIIEIKKNTVKGVTENLECNFTSTTRFDRLFSTVIIMNTFEKYFQYERDIRACGIQNIHMGGSEADWQKLITKLQYLEQYDVNGSLKTYVKGLKPVLEQFLETYKGRAHLEFWNNIYQERQNPDYNVYLPRYTFNGWLLKFFTNLNQMTGDQRDFPLAQVNVPVDLRNEITNQRKKLVIQGGIKGISIEQGRIYRPHYSFIIGDKQKPFEKSQLEKLEQPSFNNFGTKRVKRR